MKKKKKINFIVWIPILLTFIGLIFIIINYIESRVPVNITGEWKVVFNTEESSYAPYINSVTKYKVYFNQNEKVVSGDGESWEFDSDLKYESHIPINFKGKINSYKVDISYTLYGFKRITRGILGLKVNNTGDYIYGSFSGTGADVKGYVEAYKLN